MKAEHDGFQKVLHLLFEESIFSLQVYYSGVYMFYLCQNKYLFFIGIQTPAKMGRVSYLLEMNIWKWWHTR